MRHIEGRSLRCIKPSSLPAACGAMLLLGACTLLTGCAGGQEVGQKAAIRPPTEYPAAPIQVAKQDLAAPVQDGKTGTRSPNVIRIADKHRRGVIQADLEPDGANFADEGYDTILFNVGSPDREQLVAWASRELQASRQVVLDSNGGETQMSAISDITMELVGAGQRSEGVLIYKDIDGSVNLTPVETDTSFKKRASIAVKPLSRGNTARYLFGNSHLSSH